MPSAPPSALSPALPSGRIALSYQGAAFRRSGNILAVAGAIILLLVFVKFPREIPAPGTVAGPPLPAMLLGFVAVCCIFHAISDALIVLDVRRKLISFDEERLYISKHGRETVILLASITSIRLAPEGINRTVRGNYVSYLIDYEDDGRMKDTEIGIFSKMGPNLTQFMEQVRQQNPSVEIKNRSTSLDGLIRLFRRNRP